MDDNELQNGVQQVKTEQEKLSQSIQSFEYGASTAADLAKTTPWDDANDLLDHLQTVLKVVTSVEESAQDLDSTSQTQASAIDRLCKEARKRRDAARQTLLENQATTRRLQEEGNAQNTGRQAIQTAQVTLQVSQRALKDDRQALRDERGAFDKERQALRHDRIAFDKEKATMQGRLAERETQVAALEKKLATANNEVMSRLEESFKEVKLGTESQSTTLTAINDNAAKIPELKGGVDKIPDIAQKLNDAANERAGQSKMVTEDAISQILAKALAEQKASLEAKMVQQQESLVAKMAAEQEANRKAMAKEQESGRKALAAEGATLFNQLKEMMKAHPPTIQPSPLPQQLGSQPPPSSQHPGHQPASLSQQPDQRTTAAASSLAHGASTAGAQSSRKRQREDNGADDEGQATGGGAQSQQYGAQMANTDKEVDKLIEGKPTQDPLSDIDRAEVKRVWGQMTFEEGFTKAKKLYFLHRLIASVQSHDTKHPTMGLLKDAAASAEPFCVISNWMKKKGPFNDKEVEGPDGGRVLVKDGSKKCKRCTKLCVRVDDVALPGGVHKFKISKRA